MSMYRSYIEALSDEELRQIHADMKELRENASIGNCALRSLAEKVREEVCPYIDITRMMVEIHAEVCEVIAERYFFKGED